MHRLDMRCESCGADSERLYVTFDYGVLHCLCYECRTGKTKPKKGLPAGCVARLCFEHWRARKVHGIEPKGPGLADRVVESCQA